MVIKKEDNIMKILTEYPETMSIFSEFGFGCVGCALARFESIEQGANAHQIEVEKLLEAINKAIKEGN